MVKYSLKAKKNLSPEKRRELANLLFSYTAELFETFNPRSFIIKKEHGRIFVNAGSIDAENGVVIPPLTERWQEGKSPEKYAGLVLAVLAVLKTYGKDEIEIQADFTPERVFGNSPFPSVLDALEFAPVRYGFESPKKIVAREMVNTLERELSKCKSFDDVRNLAQRWQLSTIMISGTKVGIVKDKEDFTAFMMLDVETGEVKTNRKIAEEIFTERIKKFWHTCGDASLSLVTLSEEFPDEAPVIIENDDESTVLEHLDAACYGAGSARFRLKESKQTENGEKLYHFSVETRDGIPIGEIEVAVNNDYRMAIKEVKRDGLKALASLEKTQELDRTPFVGKDKDDDIQMER